MQAGVQENHHEFTVDEERAQWGTAQKSLTFPSHPLPGEAGNGEVNA